jgi:hypothetical protein
MSQRALQRTHFVRSCGPTVTERLSASPEVLRSICLVSLIPWNRGLRQLLARVPENLRCAECLPQTAGTRNTYETVLGCETG